MTEQEQININIQRQIDAQNARIDNVLAKIDTIIGEMRDRDNQRADDIREIRSSIDGMGKQIQNLTIAAVVGFGAIALAVGGLVISALK